MAPDSRPRPVRRPARRRVPLLTALALLLMAAGLWFAGPAVAPVPAPRLQVAEARVAAAENAIAQEPAQDAPGDAEPPMAASGADAGATETGPVAGPAGALAAIALAAAGPRAPPHR